MDDVKVGLKTTEKAGFCACSTVAKAHGTHGDAHGAKMPQDARTEGGSAENAGAFSDIAAVVFADGRDHAGGTDSTHAAPTGPDLPQHQTPVTVVDMRCLNARHGDRLPPDKISLRTAPLLTCRSAETRIPRARRHSDIEGPIRPLADRAALECEIAGEPCRDLQRARVFAMIPPVRQRPNSRQRFIDIDHARSIQICDDLNAKGHANSWKHPFAGPQRAMPRTTDDLARRGDP
ncbi:MAG: hypothetical protein AAF577_06900 [Pseudomonadota bacterium]